MDFDDLPIKKPSEMSEPEKVDYCLGALDTIVELLQAMEETETWEEFYTVLYGIHAEFCTDTGIRKGDTHFSLFLTQQYVFSAYFTTRHDSPARHDDFDFIKSETIMRAQDGLDASRAALLKTAS